MRNARKVQHKQQSKLGLRRLAHALHPQHQNIGQDASFPIGSFLLPEQFVSLLAHLQTSKIYASGTLHGVRGISNSSTKATAPRYWTAWC